MAEENNTIDSYDQTMAEMTKKQILGRHKLALFMDGRWDDRKRNYKGFSQTSETYGV